MQEGVSNPASGPVVYCTHCGVRLQGQAIGTPCPNCRMPVGMANNAPRPSNGKAIASMVLGICSFVGCMFYGLPGIACAVLAIVFARQVKQQFESGQTHESAMGMANAGRICGWIGLCLSIAMILLMIAYFVFIIVMVGTMSQNINNQPQPGQPFFQSPSQPFPQPQPYPPSPNP